MDTDPHTLAALALLTTATADYESAWRDSVAASLGSEAHRTATDALRRTNATVAQATAALADSIGPSGADAVRGALIMAAARTHGHRPKPTRDRHSPEAVRDFIMLAVRGEA